MSHQKYFNILQEEERGTNVVTYIWEITEELAQGNRTLKINFNVSLSATLKSSFHPSLFLLVSSTSSASRTAGCTRPMAVWYCSPSLCAASPSFRTCTGCTATTTASRSTACPSTCRCPPTWATCASWHRRSTGSSCFAERATVCTDAAVCQTRLPRPLSLTIQRMIDIQFTTARSSRTLSY